MPIVDLIQGLGAVELRRSGRTWTGQCPFHEDRTPSLSVSPEKGLWYCHACAVGGDSIGFVARLRGLSPLDAARTICRHFGLPVYDDDPAEAARVRREAAARRRRLKTLQSAWNLAWAAASAYYRAAAKANEATNYEDSILMGAELEADALLRALESPDPAVRLAAIRGVVG